MTQTCPLLSQYRYTWPGNTEKHVCVVHALQVARVADAIGLPLQMIDVPINEQVQCQQPLSDDEKARLAALDTPAVLNKES